MRTRYGARARPRPPRKKPETPGNLRAFAVSFALKKHCEPDRSGVLRVVSTISLHWCHASSAAEALGLALQSENEKRPDYEVSAHLVMEVPPV